jgi:hypothetical protein
MPIVPRSVGDAAEDARELMRRLEFVVDAAAKAWQDSKKRKPIGQVAQSNGPDWRGQEDNA